MRKVLAIVLAITLFVAFAGCGTSEEKSVETSYEISGDVMDADGKNITIETDDDEFLTFNYEGVQVDEPDGTSEFSYGQVARISYSGEINGTDTSGCTVSHIVITVGEEKSVTGKLEAVNDDESTIVIRTDDDELLSFDVSGAERHYADGLKEGDDLVVMYVGRINGEDTSKLHVRCVVDETVCNVKPEEETVTVTSADENVWTKGDVNIREGSSTTSDVVAEAKKGTKLHRTATLSNGWSRIEYNGKERYVVSDSLTTKKPEKKEKTTTAKTKTYTSATEPETSEYTSTTETETSEYTSTTESETTEYTSAPEPEGVTSPICGTIASFYAGDDETCMVLSCDNGKNYELDLSEADIHLLDGDTIGKRVRVEFSGEIEGTDTSGITVHAVYCD